MCKRPYTETGLQIDVSSSAYPKIGSKLGPLCGLWWKTNFFRKQKFSLCSLDYNWNTKQFTWNECYFESNILTEAVHTSTRKTLSLPLLKLKVQPKKKRQNRRNFEECTCNLFLIQLQQMGPIRIILYSPHRNSSVRKRIKRLYDSFKAPLLIYQTGKIQTITVQLFMIWLWHRETPKHSPCCHCTC